MFVCGIASIAVWFDRHVVTVITKLAPLPETPPPVIQQTKDQFFCFYVYLKSVTLIANNSLWIIPVCLVFLLQDVVGDAG